MKKTKHFKRQKSILPVLFVLFVASAMIRALGINHAVADTRNQPDMAEQHESQGDTDMGQSDIDDVETPATLSSVDVALAAVQRRADELSAWENELLQRERDVETAEVAARQALQQLETVETRVRELLSIADTAANDDLVQLTALYQSMPAEDAARLFGQMAPSFAAGFLSRMDPAIGAAILAELSPEAAYEVSITLATRNSQLRELNDMPYDDTSE